MIKFANFFKVNFLNNLEDIPQNLEEEPRFTEQETSRNSRQYLSPNVLNLCNQLEDFVDLKYFFFLFI